MKKNILALLLVVLLLAAPFALADNTTTNTTTNSTNSTQGNQLDVDDDINDDVDEVDEVDDVDEDDVISYMITPAGAEVRLLQLVKSLERNIARGEEIISEYNFTENETLLLDGQLDVLRGLLVDVENMDLNQTPSELAAAFVAVKQEALDASKIFREIARDVIGDQKANEIHERVEMKLQNRFKVMREDMEHKRNEHNALQLQRLYTRMNVDDNGMVSQIREGQADWNDVKEQVRADAKELSKQQQERVAQQVKEDRIKKQVFGQSMIDHDDDEDNALRNRMMARNGSNMDDDSEDDFDEDDVEDNGQDDFEDELDDDVDEDDDADNERGGRQ